MYTIYIAHTYKSTTIVKFLRISYVFVIVYARGLHSRIGVTNRKNIVFCKSVIFINNIHILIHYHHCVYYNKM